MAAPTGPASQLGVGRTGVGRRAAGARNRTNRPRRLAAAPPPPQSSPHLLSNALAGAAHGQGLLDGRRAGQDLEGPGRGCVCRSVCRSAGCARSAPLRLLSALLCSAPPRPASPSLPRLPHHPSLPAARPARQACAPRSWSRATATSGCVEEAGALDAFGGGAESSQPLPRAQPASLAGSPRSADERRACTLKATNSLETLSLLRRWAKFTRTSSPTASGESAPERHLGALRGRSAWERRVGPAARRPSPVFAHSLPSSHSLLSLPPSFPPPPPLPQ